MSAPRATSLYDRHVAAGARVVPFAGWQMPVSYAGIGAEHAAVRARAGVFDVSHMGEVRTHGPQATEALQHALSNDLDKLAVGGAQYSVLCREDGGIVDDLFTYRLAENEYLTVTNAANHDKDFAWLQELTAGYDAEVQDVAADYAMLAVQGPEARGIVAGLTDGELPARFKTARLTVAGAEALVCGTGYTGEDGVELLLSPDDAPAVWDALLAAGVEPVGLGARDTLRLEVGYHLYGNDMDESRNPIEAGLGWACKEATGFVGSDAVAAARASGPDEKLVAFVLTDGGIARQGNPVTVAEDAAAGAGVVTSGTMSPSLGVGIGMAYVPAGHADPQTGIVIDVRGKPRAAEIRPKPLYKKES